MNDILILLLWILVLGGIGYVIGQRKGRPVGGFILGALIGPIGWLLVGFGNSYGLKCPSCKGQVPKDATKCMHCGSELSTSA